MSPHLQPWERDHTYRLHTSPPPHHTLVTTTNHLVTTYTSPEPPTNVDTFSRRKTSTHGTAHHHLHDTTRYHHLYTSPPCHHHLSLTSLPPPPQPHLIATNTSAPTSLNRIWDRSTITPPWTTQPHTKTDLWQPPHLQLRRNKHPQQSPPATEHKNKTNRNKQISAEFENGTEQKRSNENGHH